MREGVDTLRKVIGISTGIRSSSGNSDLSRVNDEFFEGTLDVLPIETVEEASRLRSLSPADLVAEIAKIQQKQIAICVEESTDEEQGDTAKMYNAIWMLRNEGFNMGLRSIGLTIDREGLVVPGGARLSEDQQRQAVSVLDKDLPVIMGRTTYGKENFI
ncbi:MAG: hypothetical protein AAB553_05785 [Patescibacteria group bacterium]